MHEPRLRTVTCRIQIQHPDPVTTQTSVQICVFLSVSQIGPRTAVTLPLDEATFARVSLSGLPTLR